MVASVRHCGLIANRCNQANWDFSCVRNMLLHLLRSKKMTDSSARHCLWDIWTELFLSWRLTASQGQGHVGADVVMCIPTHSYSGTQSLLSKGWRLFLRPQMSEMSWEIKASRAYWMLLLIAMVIIRITRLVGMLKLMCGKLVELLASLMLLVMIPKSSPPLETSAPPLAPECTAAVLWSITASPLLEMMFDNRPRVTDGPNSRCLGKRANPTAKTSSPCSYMVLALGTLLAFLTGIDVNDGWVVILSSARSSGQAGSVANKTSAALHVGCGNPKYTLMSAAFVLDSPELGPSQEPQCFIWPLWCCICGVTTWLQVTTRPSEESITTPVPQVTPCCIKTTDESHALPPTELLNAVFPSDGSGDFAWAWLCWTSQRTFGGVFLLVVFCETCMAAKWKVSASERSKVPLLHRLLLDLEFLTEGNSNSPMLLQYKITIVKNIGQEYM